MLSMFPKNISTGPWEHQNGISDRSITRSTPRATTARCVKTLALTTLYQYVSFQLALLPPSGPKQVLNDIMTCLLFRNCLCVVLYVCFTMFFSSGQVTSSSFISMCCLHSSMLCSIINKPRYQNHIIIHHQIILIIPPLVYTDPSLCCPLLLLIYSLTPSSYLLFIPIDPLFKFESPSDGC